MIINEYRVINNCTEQEYQVGKSHLLFVYPFLFFYFDTLW